MTNEQLIREINKLADRSVKQMNRSIPGLQRSLLAEVETLVRQLDYTSKRTVALSVKNMRAITSIEAKLRRITLNAGYEEDAKAFIKSFSEITTLQNLYLRRTLKDFKVGAVLKQIKQQSIQTTIDALTENGLDTNLVRPVTNILRTNVTSGGTFSQIMEQLRASVSGGGLLERYVKQVTTDSLNQYSRNYLQLAVRNTGLEWYQYTGSNIKTTRCFCLAMTKKRFFHVSEIPKLIAGDFAEFEEMKCSIDDKTDLPDGMIPGTNSANFLTNLGGYNCGHRGIPVLASLVPENIRTKIKTPS